MQVHYVVIWATSGSLMSLHWWEPINKHYLKCLIYELTMPMMSTKSQSLRTHNFLVSDQRYRALTCTFLVLRGLSQAIVTLSVKRSHCQWPWSFNQIQKHRCYSKVAKILTEQCTNFNFSMLKGCLETKWSPEMKTKEMIKW